MIKRMFLLVEWCFGCKRRYPPWASSSAPSAEITSLILSGCSLENLSSKIDSRARHSSSRALSSSMVVHSLALPRVLLGTGTVTQAQTTPTVHIVAMILCLQGTLHCSDVCSYLRSCLSRSGAQERCRSSLALRRFRKGVEATATRPDGSCGTEHCEKAFAPAICSFLLGRDTHRHRSKKCEVD